MKKLWIFFTYLQTDVYICTELIRLFDTIESIRPTSVEAKVSLTLKDQGISKKVVVNWMVSLSKLNAIFDF